MTDPVTFAPGGSATTTSPSAYVIPLNLVRFLLKGQYHNPLSDADSPLPPHAFSLFDTSLARTPAVFGEPSKANGLSWILYEDDGRTETPGTAWALAWSPLFDRGGALRADPLVQQAAEVFVDLEKNAWVAPYEVDRVDRRKLLRLPLWASVLKLRTGGFLQSPKGTGFSNTGLLKQAKNELKPYGTPKEPWVIQIDHGLLRSWVRLHYYDPVEKARKALPRGVVLSALGLRRLSVGPVLGDPRGRVAAATCLDDSGTFYLLHERTKASAGTHYYFATSAHGGADNAIIDYAIPAPAPGRPDLRMKILADDPNPRPDVRYVLPTEWHSHGMQAWLDEDGHLFPKRKTFEELRTADTTKARPLCFHLDDAVLAAGPIDLAPLAKDQRIALFDHLLHLREADPKKPHLWKTTLHTNYLPAEDAVYVGKEGIERVSRLAYMDGVFYDLRDRRLGVAAKEMLGVTPGVGARAFVANDFDDRHKMVSYMNGNPAMPSFDNGRGRSQFHLLDVSYLKHMLPLASGGVDMDLLHLLVFVPFSRNEKTSQADWDAEFLPYLNHASERWDQAHPGHPEAPDPSHEAPATLALVPKGGATTGQKVIKVRHYFGEVPPAFPDSISVSLRRWDPGPHGYNRAGTSALSRVMDLVIGDIGPKKGGVGEPGQAPATTFCTLAHEIGHALGHPDEYIETVEGPFRGWEQYSIDDADGRPFFNDEVGIMRLNNKPRLRHYWNYANRVSAESAFRKMAGGQDYVACNTWVDGAPLRYDLPFIGALENGGNPYSPVDAFFVDEKKEGAVATLYRLGQDEGAVQRMFKGPGGIGTALPPAKRFDGLLLLRIRFMFDFEKRLDVPPSRIWAYHQIRTPFAERTSTSTDFVSNMFSIEVDPPATTAATAHPCLRRIALAIVPEFDYKSRFRAMDPPLVSPLGDVNIKVVWTRSGPHPLLSPIPPTGEMEILPGELELDALALVRYALGLPTFAEHPTTHVRTLKRTLSATDLQFIGDAVNARLFTPHPFRRVVRSP